METATKAKHTKGPFKAEYNTYGEQWIVKARGYVIAQLGKGTTQEHKDRIAHDAALLAASPLLLECAQAMYCLDKSPRFQNMTVTDAMAEIKLNGCMPDFERAITLATIVRNGSSL